MRLLTIFILFLGCFSPFTSVGQQRYFGHYGLPEGLPQETILCMDHDASGFLWLGTSDGIVRYDGIDFYVPPEDRNSGYDLSGWRIGAILADGDLIYAGTGQKGILVYNSVAMTTSQLGDANGDCSALAKTSKGVLAGYYDQGLALIDNKGRYKLLRFSKPTSPAGSSAPKRVTAILEFNHTIYIGTDEGILWQINVEDLDSEGPIQLTKVNIFDRAITRLVTKNEALLVSTFSGLYRVKNGDVELVNFKNDKNEVTSFTVMDYVDTPSNTFIATSNGLLEGSWSDTLTFTYTYHYKADVKYDPYALNRDGINDIHYFDGVLSIGHNSLDQTTVETQKVFQSVLTKYNLGNPSTFAILETDSQLWVGTTSGLLIQDKNSNVYAHFPEVRSRSIIDDHRGTIWVGTGTNLLLFDKENFDYRNPSFQIIDKIVSDKVTVLNPNIRSVYKDKTETLWVVTYNKGVFKLQSREGTDTVFKAYFTNNDARMLPSPFTININQDGDNNYWLTSQKGLSKIDFSVDPPLVKNYYDSDGLATSGVLSTYVDSKNQVWIATRKGLSLYNSEKDRFTSYKKRDGLSNAFVYNILDDQESNLWISTNGGLFRFDTKNKIFANYTPKDGVQSTEFNLGASFKNEEGMLYFGGIAGLNKFDPATVKMLDKPSPIRFTKIESQEKQVLSGKEASLALKTAYNAFPLNFSFAARDYRPTKNIEYQYRLLPDNTTWNALGDKNDIQFLSLATGDHTLEVQGLSRGIAWQQEALKLDITITPPWYQSWWAYLAYLLLFLTAVFIYYKITLQRRLAGQEAKRLQDLDDLKSRFITNITHEFRTPLTVILGYVQNLKPKVNETPKASDELNTIEKNSENLLGLVNQMLDLAKLEQGRLTVTYHKNDIAAFAKVLLESFESVAHDKAIKLLFKNEMKDTVLDYDEEKIRQILTNLISNAIKFTPEKGTVQLAISEKASRYAIEVNDTGSGIPKEDLPQIFDRFYQVENNSFKVSQGTGIGLALTKELVELMQGSISASSELGKGTSFIVQLPIIREASYKEFSIPEDTRLTNHIYVPTSETISAPQDAPTILVVEDNKDMSRFICSCLESSYNILTSFDGKKGLEQAILSTPDIILSDVMMPEMDGFEMTRRLQQEEATNHIPIVLLTSKALHEDKMEGLESGAEAYLNKPFQKEELLLRLQKLIEKRKLLQEKYQASNFIHKTVKKSTKDKNSVFIEKIISIINDHLDDPEFNASKLAQEAALSESQLYRKLKAISDNSTAIFIRSVRLENAKKLLLETEKTVSEIAYETGFSDPNWFGKVFKEAYNTSPSSFRKPSKDNG